MERINQKQQEQTSLPDEIFAMRLTVTELHNQVEETKKTVATICGMVEPTERSQVLQNLKLNAILQQNQCLIAGLFEVQKVLASLYEGQVCKESVMRLSSFMEQQKKLLEELKERSDDLLEIGE